MLFTTTFKKTIKNSFKKTKQDISVLYEHIQYLHNEVAQLKAQNEILLKQLKK